MTADETALLAKMQPGTKWRAEFGPDGLPARLYHVLAIVDGEQVVVKRWLQRKQMWRYEVQDVGWFCMIDKGETSALELRA